jgi:hypothetical protein
MPWEKTKHNDPPSSKFGEKRKTILRQLPRAHKATNSNNVGALSQLFMKLAQNTTRALRECANHAIEIEQEPRE